MKVVKKIFNEHVKINPIHTAQEESQVTIESDFDPAKIKISGNLNTSKPYQGTLIHRGWQVTEINLPQVIKQNNSHIICPAEVEIK